MKILILILSSPDIHSVYKLHKDIWKKYMNSNSNIDCYFMEYSLTEDFFGKNIVIKENTIYIKGVESLHPGCRDKTFDCLEYFFNNNYKYEFIIRTNLSSLWNLNALFDFLKTLPKTNVYCGVIGYESTKNVYFASGAGMIMSPDIVKLIIENRQLAHVCNYIDDVDIGYILSNYNIRPSSASRMNIFSMNDYNNFKYDKSIYHYRIKSEDINMRHDEPIIMLKILDMINNT